jgi:hypothetical protein
MSIESAIQAGGDRTTAELRNWLDEAVVLSRHNVAYTWAGLSDRLGILTAAGVRQLVNALKQDPQSAAAAEIFDDSLKSGGVNFALDSVQEALQQMRVGMEADNNLQGVALVDALLALGVTRGPRYRTFGLDVLPNETAIDAAKTRLGNIAAVTALVNEVINPAIGQGASLVEVKALVAAWGGEV